MIKIKRGFTVVLFLFVVFFIFIIFLLSIISIISAPLLTITNPANGTIFNTEDIQINLTSNETSDFFIIENRLRSTHPHKISSCDDVTLCNFTFEANEGLNLINIRIINENGDIDSENLDFFVDTVQPKIIKTIPDDGDFVNNLTNFSVTYTENNLANITLYFNNTNKTTKTDCESGTKKTCQFSIDLTVFNGQNLSFWFDVVDIANNRRNSSFNSSFIKIVAVDTEKPVNRSANFTIDERKVFFSFEIEEENFDKILLRDNRARHPRWLRLCGRLVAGICTPRKTFSEGLHEIDVKVLDLAGNEQDIYVREIFEI